MPPLLPLTSFFWSPSPIAFSYLISSVSFLLCQSLGLSLLFMILAVLKNIAQIFCRMSLPQTCLVWTSYSDWVMGFGEESQRWVPSSCITWGRQAASRASHGKRTLITGWGSVWRSFHYFCSCYFSLSVLYPLEVSHWIQSIWFLICTECFSVLPPTPAH